MYAPVSYGEIRTGLHAALQDLSEADRPALRGINVSYDCPYHIDLDHALNIDFVNEAKGPGARVAVELTPESARKLAQAILAALEEAEADGWLSEAAEHAEEPVRVIHSHAD